MKNALNLLLLSLLLTNSSQAGFFGSKDPVVSCRETLAAKLLRPSRHELSYLGVDGPSWTRLKAVFESVSESRVNKAFSKIDPSQIAKVSLMIQMKQIEATPEEALFFKDMAKLVQSDSSIFNVGEEGSIYQNLVAGIDKLRAKERETGSFGRPLEIIENLMKAESEMLSRVASKKDGNAAKRFIFPTYKRVLQVLGFHDYVFKEVKTIGAIDEIVKKILEKKVELGLTEQEVDKIDDSLADTQNQLTDLLLLVTRVYGAQALSKPTTGGPDIYQLYGRVRAVDFENSETESKDQAAEDFDKIDTALETHRGENRYKDLGLRLNDFQLMSDVRKWNSIQLMETYRQKMSEKPGVSFTSTYTESYTVTVGSGKDARTETRYRTVTDTNYPTYEQIVSDHYSYSGSAGSGLDVIRRTANKLSNKEQGLREPVLAAQKLVKELFLGLKGGTEVGEILKSVLESETSILAAEKELQAYADWTAERVLAQYSQDNFDDFKERNTALWRRATNLRRLVSVIGEISKNSTLKNEGDYELPDRALQLGILQAQWRKNLAIKGSLGLAAVTSAAGYTAYENPDQVRQIVDSTRASLNGFTQALGYQWSEFSTFLKSFFP